MNARKESSNLDFLRAVAVLLVLANHLLVFFGTKDSWFYPLRKIGPLGVLLFFVHTSLVLMFSLERQESKYGTAKRWRIFITRRIFRIYPLSMLVVSLIFILHVPNEKVVSHGFEAAEAGRLAFVSNILLAQNILYMPSITGPLWSLPYEMQMYLFLPLAFLIARKINHVGAMLALWAVFAALVFTGFPIERAELFVQYVPCFLPGIIAFRLSSMVRPTWPFWSFALLLAACIGAYVVLFLQGVDGVKSGLPICLAVGLTLPRFVELRTPWLKKACQLIARYSYGIYLAHFPLMWLAFIQWGGLPLVLQVVAFVALMVAAPVLLYHTVESPMITVGNRVSEALFGLKKKSFPAPELAADTASVP